MLQTIGSILAHYPVCDACLGRQYSLLATGTTNRARGAALKLALALTTHEQIVTGKGDRDAHLATLRHLARHGDFDAAREMLEQLEERGESGGESTNGESTNGTGPSVPEPDPFTCHLCENLFARVAQTAQTVARALEDYEFADFLLGTRLADRIVEREDELRQRFQLVHGEAMKSHLNREVGKVIQKLVDRPVNFTDPNVVAILTIDADATLKGVHVQANPLCIYGRYQKLVRGIPQTHWPCRACRGAGCAECNFTGKTYQTSVEELVSPPFLEAAAGTETKFHGAGREDIDALCIGDGRPFVLEIKHPKRRYFDVNAIRARVNAENEGKVHLSELRFCQRAVIKKIKAQSPDAKKRYRATCAVEGDMSQDEFQAGLARAQETLATTPLAQRTPLRVVHRRADKTREKRVFALEGTWIDARTVQFTITAQGGTYIKELISGDEERTQPNLSALFNHSLECTALDVVAVHQPALSEEEDFL